MTSAPVLIFPAQTIHTAGSLRRPLGLKLLRGLFFCLLFSIIFAPEFAREGVTNPGSFIYSKAAGGFRYIDLGIAVLVLVHVICLCCRRRKQLSFPRSLLLPGMAFLVCIAIAMGYGASRGGENFFFDWRGLALGIGLYVVWAFWLQSGEDVSFAIRVFAVYMGIRIVLLYALYAGGYWDTLLGIAIPVFDGPVLSCIAFAALLAFSCQDGDLKHGRRLAMKCLAAAAGLMVLLCMRRTYWGEIGIGTAILLILQKRHRMRKLMVIAAALALAAGLLGRNFFSRLQSLDVTQADSQFSSDNADHLYDLIDAWDQVRQSPLMGIGLGTSYPTWHIRNWKSESVMVHNAPLHVWLKYGLAGMLCYLWFHLALLRWLYLRARSPAGMQRAFLAAAFAYLAAQFIVTLGFAPWPYSELQLTVLMSFIIAAAVAGSRPQLPLCPYDSALAIGHHAVL